jgi:hypothetical protein
MVNKIRNTLGKAKLATPNVCIILAITNIMQTLFTECRLSRLLFIRTALINIEGKAMKTTFKLGLSGILFGVIFTTSAWAEPADSEAIKQQGMTLVQAFSTELKANLQSAIKEGGLVKGIEVCSVKAPEIAAKHNTLNWQVKRTSLKVRNPQNQATPEELSVLEAFEVAKAGGKAVQDLSYYQVNDQGTYRSHHLMKAIPTQALCLACHGETLSPEVQAVLSQRYPQDQATGFAEGDIRGAFSLIYTETK